MIKTTKSVLYFLACIVLLIACDDQRIYEKNADFDSRFWNVKDQPQFEFEITDTIQPFNLYANIRNTVSYPYSRLFFTYYLQDSTGAELEKKLVSHLLFDEKTGEPQGTSGIGDIYDHRIPLLNNYHFRRAGKYTIKLEQFMRTDSLQGVLAVGVRVETMISD